MENKKEETPVPNYLTLHVFEGFDIHVARGLETLFCC